MADTASRSRMSLYCDVFIVLASHIDEVVSVRTTDSSEFFLCWATIFRKKYSTLIVAICQFPQQQAARKCETNHCSVDLGRLQSSEFRHSNNANR